MRRRDIFNCTALAILVLVVFLRAVRRMDERPDSWKLALRKHLRDIAEARRRVKGYAGIETCTGTVRKVVEERSDSYFSELKRHLPYSRAVSFVTPADVVDEFVTGASYPPSSNDCYLLEAKSIGSNVNRTDCSHEVNRPAAKSGPFRNREKYPVRDGDEVTWSYLVVLPNATVNADGDVISGRTKLVPDRCYANRSRMTCFKADARSRHDEVFTISQYWGGGFFHGTVENLPRLALYLPYLRANPGIRIHVASGHPFLAHLGLPPDRLVLGTVQARVLYVPAGGSCGGASSVRLRLLSDELRRRSAPLGGPGRTPGRRSVVVVRRSTRRWFDQHDAIVAMIRRHAAAYDLAVDVFADSPLPAVQAGVDMFRRAVVVVAPHGAGEANLLLSRPGTVLIEGLCYDRLGRLNLCYQRMAFALGMRYYGLVPERSCHDVTAADVEAPLVKYLKLVSNTSQ